MAEKPPPPAVTSSVSCWPSGVNYFIPVISVRASEGATHTSFEVPEKASFKGYFIFLVVILKVILYFSSYLCEIGLQCFKM